MTAGRRMVTWQENPRHRSAGLEFQLERLEQRLLLAGSVAVSVAGNNVTIRGDSEANQIEISVDGGGQLVVAPVAGSGTTVEGGNTSVTAVNNLKILMRDGDDRVNVVAPLSIGGNLIINTAGGDDVVLCGSNALTVGRNITVIGGTDDDSFELNVNTVGGNVMENGGGDNDILQLYVQTEVAGNVHLNSGAGDDSLVYLFGAGAVRKNVTVNSGSGDDTVRVRMARIDGHVTANSGSDDDDVGVEFATIHGNTRINTGLGTDTAVIHSATFHGNVNVSMGGDADNLQIGLLGAVTLNGSRVDVRMGDDNDVVAIHVVNVQPSVATANIRLIGNSGSDTLDSGGLLLSAAAWEAQGVTVDGFETFT